MTEPEEQQEPEESQVQEELGNEDEPATAVDPKTPKSSEGKGNDKKTEPPATLAKQLEGWGKVGLLVAGLCYGLGLIITNAYLAQYGISEFSAFRTQYILTGVSFLVIASAPGLSIGIPTIVARWFWNEAPRPAKTRSHGRLELAFVGGLTLLSVHLFFMILLSMISAEMESLLRARVTPTMAIDYQRIWHLYNAESFGLAIISIPLATFIWRIQAKPGNRRVMLSKYFDPVPMNIHFGLVVLAFTMFALAYSQDGFGQVAPAYGGGYPESIQIAVDKDIIKDVAKLQLALDPDSNVVSVKLIHESDDAYFLLPPDTTGGAKCIRLPKNLTRGVVYMKQGFAVDVSDNDDVTTGSAADSTALSDSLPTSDTAQTP